MRADTAGDTEVASPRRAAARESPTRSVLITAAALSLITLICWADYISGPRIGLSLFYLVPVTAAAWYGRRAVAVLVALAAALAWTFADIASTDNTLAISVWNAFTRLVIYLGGALLLSSLKSDRERLKGLLRSEASLARTDGLTRLLNVRGFLEAADAEIGRARTLGASLALVYFDLDNFKKFNDQLGHGAGDSILEEVGRILRQAAGENEPCGRIGGDEFAALLRERSADEAQSWASDVVRTLSRIGAPYPDVGFGATAGVAYYAQPPRNGEEMLRNADDAMYHGKNERRGSVVLITPPNASEPVTPHH